MHEASVLARSKAELSGLGATSKTGGELVNTEKLAGVAEAKKYIRRVKQAFKKTDKQDGIWSGF